MYAIFYDTLANMYGDYTLPEPSKYTTFDDAAKALNKIYQEEVKSQGVCLKVVEKDGRIEHHYKDESSVIKDYNSVSLFYDDECVESYEIRKVGF